MAGAAKRWLVVALGASVLASSCSGSSDGGPSRTGAAKATTSADGAAPASEPGSGSEPGAGGPAPKFVENDCWWPRPEGLPKQVSITCGTIEVLADQADPGSERIHLAVARFHHADADAGAPPLVFLHGGPGGDSLVAAPAVETLPLDGLEQRDLILFDQRGSGRSTPSLDCPEKERATLDALTTAGTWDEEFPKVEASVKACRARLVGEGIDLDDYDTPHSVEDVEAVRRAFGIDTWNVSGRSYGTRFALAYARTVPDRVRTLLLDSVYAPDVGGVARSRALPHQAIAALTQACDAQPDCATANGQVDERLAAAVAAFDAQPEPAPGTATVDGEEQDWSFLLDGGDLAGGMFAAQYRSQYLPLLPSIIAGLARGDRSVVPAFISTGIPNLLDMSEGAFFSVECADNGRLLGTDGMAEMRKDPGRDALYALGTAEPFCQAWDVTPDEAGFNTPVAVDVPTLVFAGTLDPITPYAESKAQADRMPDARLVTVPGGGHGDQYANACTRSAATAFWDDPKADLPACVDQMAMPAFSAG